MVAMDASSIQTSQTLGSAATMTAKVAVSRGVVEEGLQRASLLIMETSLTGTRRTSSSFLEDGALLPASMIRSISSSERGSSVNVLQVFLLLTRSMNTGSLQQDGGPSGRGGPGLVLRIVKTIGISGEDLHLQPRLLGEESLR